MSCALTLQFFFRFSIFHGLDFFWWSYDSLHLLWWLLLIRWIRFGKKRSSFNHSVYLWFAIIQLNWRLQTDEDMKSNREIQSHSWITIWDFFLFKLRICFQFQKNLCEFRYFFFICLHTIALISTFVIYLTNMFHLAMV